MFGSPVHGRIQAHDEVWDHVSFRVTRTFAGHVADGDAPGVDIGNGHEGAEVVAAADGIIREAFVDPGNGAVIVRIEHPQLAASFGGRRVVTGYAHLQRIEVGLLPVVRGQVIGHVGSTGAPGQPHLHFGVNIGGVETDGWPKLDQNEEVDVETTVTTYPALRSWRARGGQLVGRRRAPAPLTKTVAFAAGSPAHADAEFAITPLPAGWPGGPFIRVVDGGLAGFLVALADVDPDAVPLPDCSAQVAAATAALQAKVDQLEADIVDLKRQIAGAGPQEHR